MHLGTNQISIHWVVVNDLDSVEGLFVVWSEKV